MEETSFLILEVVKFPSSEESAATATLPVSFSTKGLTSASHELVVGTGCF